MHLTSLFRYDPEDYWLKRGVMYYKKNLYEKDRYRIQEKLLLEYLSKLDFSTVFEIGCGYGRITKLMIDNFNIKDYLAIDISPYLIEKALSLTNKFKHIKFTVANITEFQVAKKYDLVLASEVLLHIRPAEVSSVIDKMISFSNKHVVNVDWYSEPKPKIHLGHNFVHEYVQIYKKNPAVINVNQIRVPIKPSYSIFHALIQNANTK